MNYTPTDTNLDSCQLWTNSTGTWQKNQTNTTPNNAQPNLFQKINLTDGTYAWNVQCNDTATNTAFNNTNYTINIDTTNPNIHYNPNTHKNNTWYSQNHIFINITANDNNKDTVTLEWNGINETFNNNQNNLYWENKTGLTDGNYTIRAYINDTAQNENHTTTRQIYLDTTKPT
jgi:hypothetical protein